MNKIGELAQLFAKYKIYPASCYNDHSPVKTFQRMFPEDHYGKDLEVFLYYQDYKPAQRGADLPWWGRKFFSKEIGFRVLIVGQDSLVKDAGSVVLATLLFPVIDNFGQYQDFIKKMGVKKYFSFTRYKKVKDQLKQWGIDFDFLYITDASKVYKNGSWEDRDFDMGKSRKLLEAEIELCNPDLVVLLGAQPLHLLDEAQNYASAVEAGKILLIQGRKCAVSPFLIGNGLAQPNFKRRLEIASHLIEKAIK